jgi:outer membrane protein TolC
MCRKTNKSKALAHILICLSSLFIYPGISFSSPEGEEAKGVVLCVNEKENFVFINLGKDVVGKGDSVEVYRDSTRIATASVKRAMRRMSEASLVKKYVGVNVGDEVIVTKLRKDFPKIKGPTDTVVKLKEKIRKLEEQKSRNESELSVKITTLQDRGKALEARLETLEEARKLAEKSFVEELARLERSKEATVARLEKKLNGLQSKKREAESELDTKISSLKNTKEYIEKKRVPAEAVRREKAVAKLEEKLSALQKTRKHTLEGLKKEIAALEKGKARIKKTGIPAGGAEPEPGGEGLSLEECISIAMANHLPLKIAKKQLKLAEMRLVEAGRKMGPSVTAKWEVTDGKVSDRRYDGEKISVEAKQPVFYGGELIFSVRQARVNLEIVKTDYDRIKNDLILQVKKGYYSLDKAEKALTIQEKLQERTGGLYDVTKAGYDAGVIAQVEFLKVSSQHNQANFQVASAEEDVSLAELILQQAMGLEGRIRIIPLAGPKIIKLGLQDCFDLAYLNRPEIKIGRLSMEHFEYEKKIMQARSYWPRVDFLGMYGNMREDFVRNDLGGENPRGLGAEYYLGTKVSLPVWGSTLGYSFTKEKWQPVVRTTKETRSNTHEASFSLLDRLEDFSSLKEAELEYMRSEDDRNKRKQEITLEVKEVFFKYKKSVFLMNVAKSKLEFQAKQVVIMDIRRELAEVQHSDVIEEMIKLAEEEYGYLQAISDYYIAIASLNKAVGLAGHFEI